MSNNVSRRETKDVAIIVAMRASAEAKRDRRRLAAVRSGRALGPVSAEEREKAWSAGR